MIKVYFYLFAFVSILTGSCPLQAQSFARIDHIDFEKKGDQIEITYDLLDAQPSESFEVWVKVFTADGQEIPATLFSGDIGEHIKGGQEKKIIWKAGQEMANLDAYIYIEVFAKSNYQPSAKILSQPVFKSAVLPGWGQASIRPGRPYWVMGVFVYGSLAGSVPFNRQAISLYDTYLASTDAAVRNARFTKARHAKRLSQATAWAAGGLWAGNLVWTAMMHKQKKISLAPFNKMQVGIDFLGKDLLQTTEIQVIYSFILTMMKASSLMLWIFFLLWTDLPAHAQIISAKSEVKKECQFYKK